MRKTVIFGVDSTDVALSNLCFSISHREDKSQTWVFREDCLPLSSDIQRAKLKILPELLFSVINTNKDILGKIWNSALQITFMIVIFGSPLHICFSIKYLTGLSILAKLNTYSTYILSGIKWICFIKFTFALASSLQISQCV